MQNNYTAGEKTSLPGADRPLEFPLRWPTRQVWCWDSRDPRGARALGGCQRSCLGTSLPSRAGHQQVCSECQSATLRLDYNQITPGLTQ